MLGADLVADGDVVIALGSSGLHSNGYSLVRHILAGRKVTYAEHSNELGGLVGEVLLEPTRLYTKPLLKLLADESLASSVHALSHVTGGGIAANLARVLPVGSWVELDRASWSPQPVFRVLSEWGGMDLTDTEGTWNLGIGMIAVVRADAADAVITRLVTSGVPAWLVGSVTVGVRDLAGFEQGAKGVNGGAVRLVGAYPASGAHRPGPGIGGRVRAGLIRWPAGRARHMKYPAQQYRHAAYSAQQPRPDPLGSSEAAYAVLFWSDSNSSSE